MVVEELRGLAREPDGASIGPIGEIEAGQPIIAVARGLFDGIAEIALRGAVIAAIEMFESELQRFVRGVVFDLRGSARSELAR